jgi:hypothetical protein
LENPRGKRVQMLDRVGPRRHSVHRSPPPGPGIQSLSVKRPALVMPLV